jgi:flavin-dependent dehydrogenase
VKNYDVIIVGASFAGLGVASRLRGNVLLVDRKDIGTGQTSACATPLNVPEVLGCMDSVLQVYQKGFIRTPTRSIEIELPHPVCTFDYAEFCRGLYKRIKADFLKTTVHELRNGCVVTDKGEFEANCLIDASGWRAVLASSFEEGFVNPSVMSFGLEATIPSKGTGLYFWVDPALVSRGASWLFSCGSHSRAGLGSYQGSRGVKEGLGLFLQRLGAEGNGIHGGFFPWRLRKPVGSNLFVVGDAAGQCLPFTGEGIRPAIYFGMRCGDIVQKVIDGQVSLEQGMRLYEAQVDKYRWCYSLLETMQHRLMSLPVPWLTRVLALLA